MKAYWCPIIVASAIMTVALPAMAEKRKFFLKSGDRVCFYGDSITEQRFYPTDVETYVLTRFPNMRVRFMDSGVGGDRVTGGWAGPINLRLRRDVFPFKPNVVTIMLGMNDAGYQPLNPRLFSIYRQGYEHIINSLQRHLPGVRIVLLETSPYDDVTHKLKFPGGYNSVLIHYNRFVDHLAKRHHLLCVNFNKPLVKVLKLAWRIKPKLARQIIPGRIHPSVAGQLVMAQALLKAWGAPSIISTVAINGAVAKLINVANAQVSDLKRQPGVLSWTQRDDSLPMPVIGLHENWPLFPSWNIFLPPQPNPKFTNPVAALVNKLSGFTHELDREMLTVKGLPAPDYKLLIDGQRVADFSSKDLADGINLSNYFTPMLRQAYHVSNIVWEQTQIRFVAWHGVQTTMQNFNFNWSPPTLNLPVTTENDVAVARSVSKVVRAMNRLQDAVIAQEYVANQPKLHHYALVAIGR